MYFLASPVAITFLCHLTLSASEYTSHGQCQRVSSDRNIGAGSFFVTLLNRNPWLKNGNLLLKTYWLVLVIATDIHSIPL